MTWYLLSVFVHIVAAAVWLGGMGFVALVVVPHLRRGDPAQGAALIEATGKRFRAVGWVCLVLLAITGYYNLSARRLGLSDLLDEKFRTTAFGTALTLKLGLFAAVLVLSALHDFWIGPRATAAMRQDPASARSRRLRRAASWMGRINALLALAMIFFAVTLVRGFP
jgi:putative copper export protein